MVRPKHIIWDYNGTLLDDAQFCVECMNRLLYKYGLAEINLNRYREIFDFPVIDYYKKLGFNFNKTPFDKVGLEFINLYNSEKQKLNLEKSAREVLGFFRGLNVGQSVLSAREHKELLLELENFGIAYFFDYIKGLDNHFAAGKLDNAALIAAKIGIDPQEIVFIGDTTHDFDVAEQLGTNCILIANGHQSYNRLEKLQTVILNDLSSLISYFQN